MIDQCTIQPIDGGWLRVWARLGPDETIDPLRDGHRPQERTFFDVPPMEERWSGLTADWIWRALHNRWTYEQTGVTLADIHQALALLPPYLRTWDQKFTLAATLRQGDIIPDEVRA